MLMSTSLEVTGSLQAVSVSGSMVNGISSSTSIYFNLFKAHFSYLALQITSRVLNQNYTFNSYFLFFYCLLYSRKVVLNYFTPELRPRQRQAAQSFTCRCVQSSVRMCLNMLLRALNISFGLFRNNLTLARSKLTFRLSEIYVLFQANSSTASSMCSPQSPIISTAAHLDSSSFAFSIKLQKIFANILKSSGYNLRQFLIKGKVLSHKKVLGHSSITLMIVLTMNLASLGSELSKILVKACTVYVLISSSERYSANSLMISASFSLLINFSKILTLMFLLQDGSSTPKKNNLKYFLKQTIPQLTIRLSICFKMTYCNQGISWFKKDIRLLLSNSKILLYNYGFSFDSFMQILPMARTTDVEELFNLDYRMVRIWMISSSFFGQQSSMQERMMGNCKSLYEAIFDNKQYANFLLIAMPYYSISFIASSTLHTKLLSLSLIISYNLFRIYSSLIGTQSPRFFQTISFVRPITQLFFTKGLKSLIPCINTGQMYSSLPLNRKFARFLTAKARIFGLLDEQSLVKVLMAILAKFSLAVLQMLRYKYINFFSTRSLVDEARTISGYNLEVSMPEVVYSMIFFTSSFLKNYFSGSETMTFKQFLISFNSFFLFPSKQTSSPVFL